MRAMAEVSEVIQREKMLNANEVAVALGYAGNDATQVVNELRGQGALLGVPVGGIHIYPAFQIDPTGRCVNRAVAAVNQHRNAAGQPWVCALWWLTAHPRLGWVAPKELVGGDREVELLELAGVLHR